MNSFPDLKKKALYNLLLIVKGLLTFSNISIGTQYQQVLK